MDQEKSFDFNQAWSVVGNSDEFGYFIETLDVAAAKSSRRDVTRLLNKYMNVGNSDYIIEQMNDLSNSDKKKLLKALSECKYIALDNQDGVKFASEKSNKMIAKELMVIAKEIMAVDRNKFTFQPQYELGMASNEVNVSSNGKVIGYLEAKDVPKFEKGKYNLLEPVKGWKNTFSNKLIEELGLKK